jgi:hypothetical protein
MLRYIQTTAVRMSATAGLRGHSPTFSRELAAAFHVHSPLTARNFWWKKDDSSNPNGNGDNNGDKKDDGASGGGNEVGGSMRAQYILPGSMHLESCPVFGVHVWHRCK